MIDFDALVFAPVYDTFAQPATLTIGTTVHVVDVIDGTRGVAVEEGGPIAVETIRPVADVRMRQLAEKGIAVADLVDAELVLAEQIWRIKTPLELRRDELRLILMADDADVNAMVIFRLTQAGERRVTESGERRIVE
jgi:hypothetical protein